MTDALPIPRTRRSRAASLVPTTVAIVMTAIAVVGLHPRDPALVAVVVPVVSQRTLVGVGGEQIVLELPAGTVTATLADGPAARAFAATLPVELTLRDPMGQAKSGPLSSPLPSSGPRVLDPAAGGIYYWPPSGELAIFYDDLGQTVPPPGLVPLGTVTNGLDTVGPAGNRLRVRIEQA